MAVLTETQFVPVSVSASGNTQLIAGVTGAKIRVTSFILVAAAAVTAKFVSGASPDLTGAMSLAIGKPIGDNSHVGLFETAVGAALTITLGGAVQVSGHLGYVLVT